MGATVEQVEQLLNLLREVDLPTLLAFDRKLHGCRSHIDVGTLRPSAPGYAGACEGRLTGHRHSGIRVFSHAPPMPEGSPYASIAES